MPFADRLGTQTHLANLEALFAGGTGATRQRAAFDADTGGLLAVIAHLKQEFLAWKPLASAAPAAAAASSAAPSQVVATSRAAVPRPAASTPAREPRELAPAARA